MPVIKCQDLVISNFMAESPQHHIETQTLQNSRDAMPTYKQFTSQEVLFDSDSDDPENFSNFFHVNRKTRKQNVPHTKSISKNTIQYKSKDKAGIKYNEQRIYSASQNCIKTQNKKKLSFFSQSKMQIRDKQLHDIFAELSGLKSCKEKNYINHNLKNKKNNNSQQILRENQVHTNSRQLNRTLSEDLFGSQYSQNINTLSKETSINLKEINGIRNEEQPLKATSQQFNKKITNKRVSTRQGKCLNLNDSLSETCTSLFSQSFDTECAMNIDSQEPLDVSQNLMQAFENISDLIVQTNNKYFQEIASSAKPNTFNENAVNISDAFTDTMQFFHSINDERCSQSSTSNSYVDSQEFSLKKITNKIEVISSEDKDNNVISSTQASRKLQLGLYKILKDTSLVFKGPVCEELDQEAKRHIVLTKIRTVFDSLNEDIKCGKKLSLKYRTSAWKNTVFENERLLLKSKEEAKYTLTKMDNKNSAQKFKIMIYLLKKAYNLIVMNTTCTKRELYYQIVQFVKNQNQVNGALNSVCCLLEVPPWDLGIFSTSKGLVYGRLTLTFSKDEVINCNAKGGTLIPSDMRHLQKIKSNAYFILIVEKDSIFQKLLSEDIPNKLSRSFILITGKGYADIVTRLFIKTLWTLLSIPMFILVDCDPHGIEIMLSYRFGSLNTAHLSNELALPNLRWLGVHPSEIEDLNIENQTINSKDVTKIKSLLTRPYITKYDKIKYELQILQTKRRKAEIEGLIKCNEFLSNFYIPNKLYSRDFL